jgi:hypothetical protein
MNRLMLSFCAVLVGCPQPIPTSVESPKGEAAAYSPVDQTLPPGARMGQTIMTQPPAPAPAVTSEWSESTQKAIRAGHHTVFKGEIRCEQCTGPFIVKVGAFVRPSPTANADQSNGGTPQAPTCGVGGHGADVRFPPVLVERPGAFDFAFPWHGYPVVLEVHEDSDQDGHAEVGERFAVLHEGGALMGNEDMDGLVVDFDQAPQMVGEGDAAPVDAGREIRTSP